MPASLVTIQPDIQIGGLRIVEPVITLTGLMMCALCIYALRRLGPVRQLSAPVQLIWWFFLLMALSSFVGALFGHAFQYTVGIAGKATSWTFSLLSMAALAQAAIEHTRLVLAAKTRQILTIANAAGLIGALLILLVYKNYHGMEVHAVYTMIILMVPLEWILYKKGNPGSLLLLWSVFPALLSVIPLLTKWSPHVWFTYFDLAHVLLLVSLWLIMLAGKRIQMRQ